MSFEVFASKVSVAFHDVDHDRAPGFDVAGLGFVEKDKGMNDVGAETVRKGSVCSIPTEEGDVRYQCGLCLGAASSALVTFIMVHPQQDIDVASSASTFLLEQIRRLLHKTFPPQSHPQILIIVEFLRKGVAALEKSHQSQKL